MASRRAYIDGRVRRPHGVTVTRTPAAMVTAPVTRQSPPHCRDGNPPTIAGQPIGSPVCLCLWANGKGGMTSNSRIPSPYNKDMAMLVDDTRQLVVVEPQELQKEKRWVSVAFVTRAG